jgi:hypothetical protein
MRAQPAVKEAKNNRKPNNCNKNASAPSANQDEPDRTQCDQQQADASDVHVSPFGCNKSRH